MASIDPTTEQNAATELLKLSTSDSVLDAGDTGMNILIRQIKILILIR